DRISAERLGYLRRLVTGADKGLRVHRRDVRNVAALGIGDDEQSGGLGRRDDLCQHGPAAWAEPLEARQLRLHGDAGLAGLANQAPTPLPDSRGWTRLRVQPETALAAPLRNRSGEPIRESLVQCRLTWVRSASGG